MIIDDHSRLLVGGGLFYNDNAYSYSNEQLSMICISLGILLLHTRVRDGASKGKVERHFRTLKERWLYTLDMDSITSLAQFDTMLKDYKRSYNTTFHRGINGIPLDRYRASCLLYTSPSPRDTR